MTWIQEHGISKEFTFKSMATTVPEIARDIKTVVERCISNKVIDEAETATSILIRANATNGYIEIYFGNIDDMEYIGRSQYLLNLPNLYEQSHSHVDGAGHFDAITINGSILFAESETGKQIKSNYKLHFIDDLYDVRDL